MSPKKIEMYHTLAVLLDHARITSARRKLVSEDWTSVVVDRRTRASCRIARMRLWRAMRFNASRDGERREKKRGGGERQRFIRDAYLLRTVGISDNSPVRNDMLISGDTSREGRKRKRRLRSTKRYFARP